MQEESLLLLWCNRCLVQTRDVYVMAYWRLLFQIITALIFFVHNQDDESYKEDKVKDQEENQIKIEIINMIKKIVNHQSVEQIGTHFHMPHIKRAEDEAKSTSRVIKEQK